MTNKMAARVLFYAQRLLSYGDSKGAKQKNFTKKIVLRLIYGDQGFSNAAKNDIIFSRAGTNGD